MTDDKNIILSCQKGELEQFGRLYDKYIRKIYDFIYYKVNHRETAEDICSLVFTKALKKISAFDPEAGTFQAWLYQIARNSVIDHYRTQKQADNIEDYWSLSADTDLPRDLEIKLKLEEVDQYLKALNSRQREIIIMRLWQGLSYREIADALEQSEGSVKMAFSRGLNKLRQEMPAWLFLLFLLSGPEVSRHF